MNRKIVIYQLLPRLFANKCTLRKPWGTWEENGSGHFADIKMDILKDIRALGCTHLWYTGVIRHATTTDFNLDDAPAQHPQIVKGRAGSPYAITDYYDVAPGLAADPSNRMDEFERLVQRTHKAGLKVIIDFVPNHVAREYRSTHLPEGVKDLGENDDKHVHFHPNNNFYYCPDTSFVPPVPAEEGQNPYKEFPARCTGNDHFDERPSAYDWYETVKLNYGVDYCHTTGRREHFDPVPDTWLRMTEILLFWADKGIDGFRCDMAEMVPHQFWCYATAKVKAEYPHVIFIGEVYTPALYRCYLASGFDYLYDKVGMYDCLRDVVCGRRPASDITACWQSTDDIKKNMLYFLENHDEQRIASSFFCGNAESAFPAMAVCALLGQNPCMIYAGQEVGEPGMDAEGYSGQDGRTTIFDYWCVDTLYRAWVTKKLTDSEKELRTKYAKLLTIAEREWMFCRGDFFDLMYVNPQSSEFNPQSHYVFLRKRGTEVALVLCNFSEMEAFVRVNIPDHAFTTLRMKQQTVQAFDLLSRYNTRWEWYRNGSVRLHVPAYGVRIMKLVR